MRKNNNRVMQMEKIFNFCIYVCITAYYYRTVQMLFMCDRMISNVCNLAAECA